ncbi:MAG: glycosyltransferase [Streptomyces sp.]|uniref:glycosyltransferase family 2 protein n=1 Tax=Streptomyces sp. TaxID=1931 RepID=UPI0025D6E7D6|nr:glycosyltransferase [Streptomyces sp.]MBW8792220.1 glycosyltransferase [Streptomyces sp.]
MPTARRLPQLARLLDALPAAVSGIRADVLVVDNAPEHPARAVVAAAPLPVRYVVEPQPGSAHARNRALAETDASVIAFLDDDVVPHAGWLAPLLRALEDPGTSAVGGPVLLDPEAHRPAWFDEEGIGGYLSRHELDTASRDLRIGEYLLTANAAFDVDALRSVGGFDPRLGPRPGSQLVADDVHVVRALQRAGARVRWEPESVVTHELPAERARRRWLLRRAYLQGRSDWLLDRELLEARRLGGARVALSWLGAEAARRRAEGLSRADVRFHLATDVSRAVGAVREGVGWRIG